MIHSVRGEEIAAGPSEPEVGVLLHSSKIFKEHTMKMPTAMCCFNSPML